MAEQHRISMLARVIVGLIEPLRGLALMLLTAVVIAGLLALRTTVGRLEIQIISVLGALLATTFALERYLSWLAATRYAVVGGTRPGRVIARGRKLPLPWRGRATLWAIRIFRTGRWLLLVLGGLLVISAWLDAKTHSRIPWSVVVPVLGIAIGCFVLEWILQWRLNGRFPALVGNATGDGGKFVLFLRSFNRSYMALMFRRLVAMALATLAMFGSTPVSMRRLTNDLERDAGDVAYANGAYLVAIGDKYFTLGAVKIRSHDTKWKMLFEQLADKANTVICELHSTSSCLWEIEKIVSSRALTEKTVFVLPPGHFMFDFDSIVKVAQAGGVHLPSYSVSGWAYIAHPAPEQYSLDELDDLLSSRLG